MIARKSAVLKRNSAKSCAVLKMKRAIKNAMHRKASASGIASPAALPHTPRAEVEVVEDVSFTRVLILLARVTHSRRKATNLPLEIQNVEILDAEPTAKKRPRGVYPIAQSRTTLASRCATWRTRCAR